MGNSPATVTLYLALIAGISLAGGAAPLVREWSRSQLTLLVSSGAGVLLGAAFLHMIPVAVETLDHSAGFALLGGFLAISILEKFFLIDPCEEMGCHIHRFGLAAFLGITFHSLLDGVAVGSSLVVPDLALPVFAAIAVHKIPAAFCLCSILLLSGYRRSSTLLLVAGFALATPAGAAIAWLFLKGLDPGVVGAAIGVSAGSFIAIATSDLLPQIHREGVRRGATLLFMLIGIAVMALPAVGFGFHSH